MINIVLLSFSLFKTKTKRKQLDEYAVRGSLSGCARQAGKHFLRPKKATKKSLFSCGRSNETF